MSRTKVQTFDTCQHARRPFQDSYMLSPMQCEIAAQSSKNSYYRAFTIPFHRIPGGKFSDIANHMLDSHISQLTKRQFRAFEPQSLATLNFKSLNALKNRHIKIFSVAQISALAGNASGIQFAQGRWRLFQEERFFDSLHCFSPEQLENIMIGMSSHEIRTMFHALCRKSQQLIHRREEYQKLIDTIVKERALEKLLYHKRTADSDMASKIHRNSDEVLSEIIRCCTTEQMDNLARSIKIPEQDHEQIAFKIFALPSIGVRKNALQRAYSTVGTFREKAISTRNDYICESATISTVLALATVVAATLMGYLFYDISTSQE
ncbi:MAG: hypothetical protein HN411_03100 [Waddliaceae bacterium]|nr:hypothetical protein [Waddliaceae bacterium]MBT3578861.1 hypothetical protein [Waddliaceae bacterium]MBT4444956.1 hypothetical protein [Waddliaceae bacterium]